MYGPKNAQTQNPRKDIELKISTLVLLKLPKSEQHMPQKNHTRTHTNKLLKLTVQWEALSFVIKVS